MVQVGIECTSSHSDDSVSDISFHNCKGFLIANLYTNEETLY